MGLKQDIIVVNEYTVPMGNGSGTRGGTPGAYVSQYMARDAATEPVAPIRRHSTDDFIVRYMAREEATVRVGLNGEEADLHPAAARRRAKQLMKDAVGDGGVAFGYGSVSLSDEDLRRASADIQRLFDSGHTVMKTVFSFSHDYLRQRGIIHADSALADVRADEVARGAYRGHIDQMKLRMAIMHGLDRMASGPRGFDDLRYVGVIQVDTAHVHCHIAAVDAGRGRIAADGNQRGKLLPTHTSRFRRGVDAWLDQKQAVAHLSSAVGYERRNVTSYIKRWAHEQIRGESLPQFLLACLPRDRRLWRAGSRHPAMRKANAVVGELVTEQLERAGSPMGEAMASIHAYARERQVREGLGEHEVLKLVDNGRRLIHERSVNAVYQMLATLDPQTLTVHTPMLEVMSAGYESLALRAAGQPEPGAPQPDPPWGRSMAEGELVRFGFRLRSYASRLRHHQQHFSSYRELARRFEQLEVATQVSAESVAMYDFYRHEETYHHQLMVKYRHFLPFADPSFSLGGSGALGTWGPALERARAYGERLTSLMALRADATLARMKDAEAAETLGREVYGQHGGGLLTQGKAGRSVLDERLSRMRATYTNHVSSARHEMALAGVDLLTERDETGRAVPGAQLEAIQGSPYPFERVRALDLHRLGYDFVNDVPVDRTSAQVFVEVARERERLLRRAVGYLRSTDQEAAVSDLPVDDIAAMLRCAVEVEHQHESNPQGTTTLLRSRVAQLREQMLAVQAPGDAEAIELSLPLGLAGEVNRLDAGLYAAVGARIDQVVRQSADPAELAAQRAKSESARV